MTKRKAPAKRKLRVIMLADEKLLPTGDLKDFSEKQRELRETEFDVRDAIEALGHEVFSIGVSDDLSTIRGAIDAHKPHVAFNLVEEFGGIGPLISTLSAIWSCVAGLYALRSTIEARATRHSPRKFLDIIYEGAGVCDLREGTLQAARWTRLSIVREIADRGGVSRDTAELRSSTTMKS